MSSKKEPVYIGGLSLAAIEKMSKRRIAETLAVNARNDRIRHAADLSRLGEQNARMIEELNRVSTELATAKRCAAMRNAALHAIAYTLPPEQEKAVRVLADAAATRGG